MLLERARGHPALGWRTGPQLVRFAAVGAANTCADLMVFYGLAAVIPPRHHPWLAAGESLAGWAVGTVVGHRLHSRVTFGQWLPPQGFYPVAVAGMLLQSAVTAGAAWWLGSFGAWAGKPLGIGLAALVTYLGYRRLARRSHLSAACAARRPAP